MPETTTSFHIGDRVRIADTNPAWDGWTGTVSPSSAEQRAGDPATLNEHGRLLVALDSGGTQQVLPQGLIPLTYDYAIISGGWSLEQRRHIAEAMAASGLDTAWGALYFWKFRLWSGRPQAKLNTWQRFWGAPPLEGLLERIRARTIYRFGDLPADARQIERDALVERGWIRADEPLSATCWVVERPSYIAVWSTAAQAVTPDTVLQQRSLGVGAWPTEADAVPSTPLREPPDLAPWHVLD